MQHFFVSYAREDRDWAEEVRRLIQEEDLHLWQDQFEMRPADWKPQAFAAIEDSAAVIFLASPRSLTSLAVREELEHARRAQKEIVWLAVHPAARRELISKPPHPLKLLDPDASVGGLMDERDTDRLLTQLRLLTSRLLPFDEPPHDWGAVEGEGGPVIAVPAPAGVRRRTPFEPPAPAAAGGTSMALVDRGGAVVVRRGDDLVIEALVEDGEPQRLQSLEAPSILDILSARFIEVVSVAVNTVDGWAIYDMHNMPRGLVEPPARLRATSGSERLRSAALGRDRQVLIGEDGRLLDGHDLLAAEADHRWVDVDAATNARTTVYAALSQTSTNQYLHVTTVEAGRPLRQAPVVLDVSATSVRVARTPLWGTLEPSKVVLRRESSFEVRVVGEVAGAPT